VWLQGRPRVARRPGRMRVRANADPVSLRRRTTRRECLHLSPFALAGEAPACRGLIADALEDGRKMRLRAEADRKRNLRQRPFGGGQQRLGVLDPVIEQIFSGPITGRGAELRCKVHSGQAGDIGEFGQANAAVEMIGDILLDPPQPPFRQGIDPGAWQFQTCEMHRKGLADAARKLVVRGVAKFDQRLGKLGCERIAQQDEIIQSLGPGKLCRKLIRGDVKVQEGAWQLELHGEGLRRRGEIQCARGHGPVENDLAIPGQFRARGLEGDADEIAILRRRRLVRRGAPRVFPSRDRYVLGRRSHARIDLTPLTLPNDRVCCLGEFAIPRGARKFNPGGTCLQIGQHRSSSPGVLRCLQPANAQSPAFHGERIGVS
jgi:hypothetical protein